MYPLVPGRERDDVRAALNAAEWVTPDGMPAAWALLRLGAGDPKLWLQVADIALNPIAAGCGMNVTMLEYLAFELPIVAPATGARGMDCQDGRHLRVAAPSDFAQAVRQWTSASAARFLG